MDWRNLYRKLEEKGYRLVIPRSKEREDFRRSMEKQHRLEPRVSKTRAIYIVGIGEKFGAKFFDDPAVIGNANKDVSDCCIEIKRENSAFQFCGYLYESSPTELVARRLNAGQGTIEFIDAYQDHKAVIVTWFDNRKKK